MVKIDMTRKIAQRSNSIEYRDFSHSRLFFDHSTGNMMQFGFDCYGQGFTQTWSQKGYGISAKLESFRTFVGE